MVKTLSNRIEYISLASVLSAIAVVYLHVNGPMFHNFSYSRGWITGTVLDCFFSFAVPIFFMISGALLIDFNKKYDIKTYFSKRISKTVIPFLAWSFIALFIQIFIFSNISLSEVNLPFIINNFIYSGFCPVYWFFLPLFGCYLTIPILSFIQEDKKKDIFIYITTILFILNSLIPFIIAVFSLPINYPLSLNDNINKTFLLFNGCMFYVLVGYLIHKYEISKKSKIIIYVLAIIGLLINILGTIYSSYLAGQLVLTYIDFLNVPSIMYSIGLFVFFKYDLIKIMNVGIIKKAINFLDFYTFGIYLIHWYLIYILCDLLNINISSIFIRLLFPIVIIGLSVLLIWLIRKIPLIKKIVP